MSGARLGPEPYDHAARVARVAAMVARAREHLGPDLLAAGAYGSLALGTDGPYSDVELLCVLRSPEADATHEWTTGPWKAEVNVRGRDTVLRAAAALAGDWPRTHGAYVHLLALYDPAGFLPQLRQAALDHPAEAFAAAMRELIVGDIYEWVGKLRNAAHRGQMAPLAPVAVRMAEGSACLLGLASRHLYRTGLAMLQESLELADRPAGHDGLCALVTAGRLSDPATVTAHCERLWAGVQAWAAARGLAVAQPRELPF